MFVMFFSLSLSTTHINATLYIIGTVDMEHLNYISNLGGSPICPEYPFRVACFSSSPFKRTFKRIRSNDLFRKATPYDQPYLVVVRFAASWSGCGLLWKIGAQWENRGRFAPALVIAPLAPLVRAFFVGPFLFVAFLATVEEGQLEFWQLASPSTQD